MPTPFLARLSGAVRGALCRYAGVSVLLVAGGVPPAWSQAVRLTIDPKASLAWWQMNPHLSHLWATTCPEDPAWQPGEGSSIGYMVDHVRRQKVSYAAHEETRIPLYPRRVVRSLCTPAVSGEVTAADNATWRGLRGTVVVRTEHLRTGLDMRDSYARKAIYGTEQYPEMRFRIDSLVNLRTGDTLQAEAVGAFEFRGKRTPMKIPIRGTPQPGGALRVQSTFQMPAAHLVDVYGVSPYALGLSVGLRVWRTLHMGVDLILRPA